MAEKVFLNNKIVDANKAKVSIADSGLLYGAGLFETLRSYNCRIFAVDDHIDRLFSSAKSLQLNNSLTAEFVRNALCEVLEANNLENARLRLTLTGGSIGDQDEFPESTLIITAVELQEYPKEYYQKGVMVTLCDYRQNVADPLIGHKTTNYFSRIMGLKLAKLKRAAEAIWFTPDNRVAEGCISNVFIAKDDTLLTPPLDTPVLPGVMRKTVLELAKENNIEAEEKTLYITDLLNADEIFLTNVIMQILPVTSVEKKTISDGKTGAVTKKLRDLFDKLLADQYGVSK
jgi:branched-chain amino acid aminotransferase